MSAFPSQSDWPADHDAIVFSVATRPNAHGGQDFFALFWRDGVRVSLGFFGRSIDEQVRAARRKGVSVEIIERFDGDRVAA